MMMAACGGGGTPGPTDPAPVDVPAEAYATVVERYLSPPDVEDERTVVYVVPVSGDALSLDTQVAVVNELAELYDVRFVDDVDAAVDDDSTDVPPRDEGMLIGLGRISADPPHTVRVELYRERDRVTGHLLTLDHDAGDHWVVVGDESVAPEVLIGDD